ncbi:MAG: hypothetical protein J6Z23_02875 [Lachnospiraceae bacterium]|nr:hypothetical protein [Lachnospiraceae bacterium]MBP5254310.1 hypothetical protein [Lachnospiraceae bacterium]
MIRIYKCPGCGSDLRYEGGTDTLVCAHCQTKVKVSELEMKEEAGVSVGLTGGTEEAVDTDGDGIREYRCPACGAELVTDEYTAATLCSFCGSPALIEGRLSGAFRPSRLIPFSFDKKQAGEHFKEWAKSGRLTPSDFKSDATMAKLTGIYVPYWLYSYTATAEFSGTAEIVRVSRRGDEEITDTSTYKVHRVVTADYSQVPFDASEKAPDESMHYLEPYDYGKLVPFSLPYLSGYFAEKFNADAEAFREGIQGSLASDILNAAVASVSEYHTVHVQQSHVDFSNEETEYVMLPVWTLNYTYHGKTYPLYMNGSTGQVDGELPTSIEKVIALFLGIGLVIFLLMFFLMR